MLGRRKRPEDGTLPLTALRLITALGMVTVQAVLARVRRLVSMVRRVTVFSHAAVRYVDGVIGAIAAAAALLWWAVTAVNAPGQRDDPAVTPIMGGIGLAVLGAALIVLLLRTLLARAASPSHATVKRPGCGPNWTR